MILFLGSQAAALSLVMFLQGSFDTDKVCRKHDSNIPESFIIFELFPLARVMYDVP